MYILDIMDKMAIYYLWELRNLATPMYRYMLLGFGDPKSAQVTLEQQA